MSSSISETFNGIVRKERVAVGSKSEREAIVLDTGTQKLVMRLGNMNPFMPQPLDTYIGQHVSVSGIAYNGTLFIGAEKDIARQNKPTR